MSSAPRPAWCSKTCLIYFYTRGWTTKLCTDYITSSTASLWIYELFTKQHSECWEGLKAVTPNISKPNAQPLPAALFCRNLCYAQQSHGVGPSTLANGFRLSMLVIVVGRIWAPDLRKQEICVLFQAGFHPENGTVPVVRSCYSNCNKISKLVRYPHSSPAAPASLIGRRRGCLLQRQRDILLTLVQHILVTR